MAIRFRIDQAGSPGVPGRTRHDLNPALPITLVAVEPANATYEWELVDRIGTSVSLSAGTGASVTLPAPGGTFAFLIELRAYVNGQLAGPPVQRIASSRTPGLGLRYPVFAETANPASRLASPNVDDSTDNALYPNLGRSGQSGQNWRGFTQWALEITEALEGTYAFRDKPPGVTARFTMAANFNGLIAPNKSLSLCSSLVLVAAGSATVTGLPGPDDNTADYALEVLNGGTGGVTFKHGATVAAGNYPFDTGGQDLALPAGQIGLLFFDASVANNKRWRLLRASTAAEASYVSGPNAATDTAIARFDAATGKLLKNSAVRVDDAGNILMEAGAKIDGMDPSIAQVKLNSIEQGAQVITFARVADALAAADADLAFNSKELKALKDPTTDQSATTKKWVETRIASIVPITGALNLYVSPNGNDAATGTSPATARKTLAGVWALLPANQSAPFTVHLASGTYLYTLPPANVTTGPRACITLIGDGAGQAGDDGAVVQASGTLASSTTGDLTINVADALTPLAYRGCTLEITSGPTAGSKRHIVSNSDSTITLSAALDVTGSGTAYRITRPGVILNMAAPDTTTRMPMCNRDLFNLVHVRIRGGTTDITNAEPLCLFGVETESQLFLGEYTVAGATASYPFWREGQAGMIPAYVKDLIAAAGLTVPLSAWNGWGLASTSTTPIGSQYAGIDFTDGAWLEGYLTMPHVTLGPGAADVVVRLAGGALGGLWSQAPGFRMELVGPYTIGSAEWAGEEVVKLFYDATLVALGPLKIGQANYSFAAVRLAQDARLLALDTVTLQCTNPVATPHSWLRVSDTSRVYATAINLSTAQNAARPFDLTDAATLVVGAFNASTLLAEPILHRHARASFTTYAGPNVVMRGNAQLSGAPRSTVAMHAYVAATSGSDTNDGWTAATARQTLEAVYKLIPALLTVPFVIHMQGGTYAQLAPPPHVQAGPYGMVILLGDGAGQAGQDGFTQQSTGTLGSGSSLSSLVSTTTTMAVDEMLGMTVEITSGPGQGCRRTVIANSANALTISYPIIDSNGANISPASGVTYRLLRPAVILNTSANLMPDTHARLSSKQQSVHYVNVALEAQGAVPGWTTHETERPCFHWGMEWRGTNMYAQGISTFGTTSPGPVDWPIEQQRAVFAACGGTGKLAKWEGWGLAASPGSPSTYTAFDGGYKAGVFGHFVNVAMTMGGGEVSMWIVGGRIQALTSYRAGQIVLGGVNPVLITPPTGLSAIGVQSATSGTNMDIALIGQVSITQKGDVPAIYLSGGARLTATLPVTVSAPDVTGANALAAIRIEGAAVAYFYDSVSGSSSFAALLVRQDGRAHFGNGLTMTQGGSSGVYGNAQVHVQGTLSLTGSPTTALTIADNGDLCTAGVVACTAAAAGLAAVNVAGGQWTMGGTSPRSIVNTSSAANSDGLRCSGGGTVRTLSTTSPTITSAGSSGYGVNCQGGGRFFCAVQPSLVYGASADFCVGPNPGEAFADTELNVPYAARSAGASVVQRAA